MSLSKTISALKKYRSFIITAHVNPDPDALCSELAMAEILRQMGKKVYILNEEKVPERFEFFPGTNDVIAYKEKMLLKADAMIILDCGDLKRIGKVQDVVSSETFIINVDHHITNTNFGRINCVIQDASSTAEIIFKIGKKLNVQITDSLALNLYSGIMTDTGSFRYENTTVETLKIASELRKAPFCATELYRRIYEQIPLNDMKLFTKVIASFETFDKGKVIYLALGKDIVKKFSQHFDLRDAIFRSLRAIVGYEVIVILTEVSNKETRVNFRSGGKVDVARIANYFGGGGHQNASGCTTELSLEEARRVVLAKLKKEVKV